MHEPYPVTTITPPRAWWRIDVGELYAYRELIGYMAWRDLKVRYKQTLLGASWAVLAPLLTTFVFTFLFGRVGSFPTDGLPGAVYYMAGIVLWRYFATSLSGAANSLVASQMLLTRIYLPRLIIPMSPIVTGLVDFFIAFVALIVIVLWQGVTPAASSILVLIPIAIAVLTSTGMGLLFAALNVRYRDIRHVVPFVTQLWMYASVIVPYSQIPESYGNLRYLYGLNPMGAAIEGFRWFMFHTHMTHAPTAPWLLMGIGTCSAMAMVLVGLYAFKRLELQFADIV